MTTDFACHVCPFDCGVDRSQAQGICQAPNELMISKVQKHFDEEPFISGIKGEGSGTIFFTHCNLGCIFCQNYLISQEGKGHASSATGFAEICEALAAEGALNINLVSPTPYSHLLVPALTEAKKRMPLPIVWNSNGYETVETLRSLEGLVDVYLPDLKYFTDTLAVKYSSAPKYFEFASQALLEMRRQQPVDVFNGQDHIQKGLVLRHLMLPGCSSDTLELLGWVHDHLGNRTMLSLMAQYYPTYQAATCPEIDRRLTAEEYQAGVDFLDEHGFENALVQELSSADCSYTPDF